MSERKIDLLYNSTIRLKEALQWHHNEAFWRFMRREVRLHLRRTLELALLIIRKKG